MSVTDGTWRRYSLGVSSRRAKPSDQPSTMANANAHAHDVAHATHGTARHGRRWATAGPHSAVARPIAIAGMVPQPTWAFHQPKIGAVWAYIEIWRAVLLISGVTIPRPRWGTVNAATTNRTAATAATISRRADFTPTYHRRGFCGLAVTVRR